MRKRIVFISLGFLGGLAIMALAGLFINPNMALALFLLVVAGAAILMLGKEQSKHMATIDEWLKTTQAWTISATAGQQYAEVAAEALSALVKHEPDLAVSLTSRMQAANDRYHQAMVAWSEGKETDEQHGDTADE